MNPREELDDLFLKLKKAIMEADYKSAPGIAQEGMKSGPAASGIMRDAIVEGIGELEEQLFGEFKATVHPDFLMAAEAARLALDEITQASELPEGDIVGTVVMGVPAGDTHDLGAKIVAVALTAAGFRVEYLGHDVPVSQFVEKISETGAKILALSSYQTTGFSKIRQVMKAMEEAKLLDKVKVMAGGSVITEKFSEELNIGYAKTAKGAVKLAQQYVGGA